MDERGNVIGVVMAKLSQQAALATSGTLAENVNYAVKSSYLLSFLESVPEVAAWLKEPGTQARQFEDVVNDMEQATVLVLVYRVPGGTPSPDSPERDTIAISGCAAQAG